MVPADGLAVHLPCQQHISCLRHGLVNGDGGSVGGARHVLVPANEENVANSRVMRLQACKAGPNAQRSEGAVTHCGRAQVCSLCYGKPKQKLPETCVMLAESMTSGPGCDVACGCAQVFGILSEDASILSLLPDMT